MPDLNVDICTIYYQYINIGAIIPNNPSKADNPCRDNATAQTFVVATDKAMSTRRADELAVRTIKATVTFYSVVFAQGCTSAADTLSRILGSTLLIR